MYRMPKPLGAVLLTLVFALSGLVLGGSGPASAHLPTSVHPLTTGSVQPLQGIVYADVQGICSQNYVATHGVKPDICLTADTDGGVQGASVTICGGGPQNCTNSTTLLTTNHYGFWYANVTNASSYWVSWSIPSEMSGTYNYSWYDLSQCGYNSTAVGKYLGEGIGAVSGAEPPPLAGAKGTTPDYCGYNGLITPATMNYTTYVHQHIQFVNSTTSQPIPLPGLVGGAGSTGDCWYDGVDCYDFGNSLQFGAGYGVIEPVGATFTIGACIPGYFCTGNQTFSAFTNTTYNVSVNPMKVIKNGGLFPKYLNGTVQGYTSTANGEQVVAIPKANVTVNYTSYSPQEFGNYVNFTVRTHDIGGQMDINLNLSKYSALGIALQNAQSGPSGVAFVDSTNTTVPPTPSYCAHRLYYYETEDFALNAYTYIVNATLNATDKPQQLTMFFAQNVTQPDACPGYDNSSRAFAAYTDFSGFATGEDLARTKQAYVNGAPDIAQAVASNGKGAQEVASLNGTNTSAQVVTVTGPGGETVKALAIGAGTYFATFLPTGTNLSLAFPNGLTYYGVVLPEAKKAAALAGVGVQSASGDLTRFAGFSTMVSPTYGSARSGIMGFFNTTIDTTSGSPLAMMVETPASYGVAYGGGQWVFASFAYDHYVHAAGYNLSLGQAGISAPISGFGETLPAYLPAVGVTNEPGATSYIYAYFAEPYVSIQPNVTAGTFRNTSAVAGQSLGYWTTTDDAGHYTIIINDTSPAYFSRQLYATIRSTDCNLTLQNLSVSLDATGNSTTSFDPIFGDCASAGMNLTAVDQTGATVQGAAFYINGAAADVIGGWARVAAVAQAHFTVMSGGGSEVFNFTTVTVATPNVAPAVKVIAPDVFATTSGSICVACKHALLAKVTLSVNLSSLPTNMTKVNKALYGPLEWAFPVPQAACSIGPTGPKCPPPVYPRIVRATNAPLTVYLPVGLLLNPVYLVRTLTHQKAGMVSPCPAPLGGIGGEMSDCHIATPIAEFNATSILGGGHGFHGGNSGPGAFFKKDDIHIRVEGDMGRVVDVDGPHAANLPPLNLFYEGLAFGSSYYFSVTNTTTGGLVTVGPYSTNASDTSKGVTMVPFSDYSEDALFTLSQTAPAGSMGQVSGYVTVVGGSALNGATVNIVGGGALNYNLFATTNAGGYYSFNVSTPGHYNVTVTSTGYDPQTKAVYLNGAAQTVSFTMVPSSSIGATVPPATIYGLTLTDWLLVGVAAIAAVVVIALYLSREHWVGAIGGRRKNRAT